ncbi:hypothetical protein [Polaromonas sp.]|nr:hypothetical protein [Polaromonas sp.]NMM07075.1 hypothetical protein [Polaromonas sp.]
MWGAITLDGVWTKLPNSTRLAPLQQNTNDIVIFEFLLKHNHAYNAQN